MKKAVQKYDAIIFDLDGTLIDSIPYHILSFKDLLLEKGIRVDNTYFKRLVGLPTEAILKELKKKYNIRETVLDLREERRYHYFKFIGRKNIVFSGIQKTLTDLRFNYKLAVATGSSKIVFKHSTDRDFQELFDRVITINDVKKGKPNPEQINLALKKLRVKKNKSLFIGDSIYDAQAAKRAGVDFIGVTTGNTPKKDLLSNGAKKVISSINELKKIL